MGKRLAVIVIIVAWVVLSGISRIVLGEEPPFTLSLQNDAEKYPRGVPVFAITSLTNTGPTLIELPAGSLYQFEQQKADGVFEQVALREILASIVGPPTPVEPGKGLMGSTGVLFRARQSSLDGRHLVFDAPGKHTFRMRFVTWLPREGSESTRVEVVSNEVTITVTPEEEGFQAFLEGLKKYTGDGARLDDDAGMRWMEQVVKNRPDSVYAQYAKGLTISRWCDKLSSEDEALRVDSDPQFVGWAGDVVTKLGTKRGFISHDSLYVLALSHLLNEQRELAEAVRATLADEFAGSGHLKDLAQVEEYIQRKGLPALREERDRRKRGEN